MFYNTYMSELVSYSVIEPPTSAEVEQQTLDSLARRGLLSLVLLPDHQVPRPERTPVVFRVRQTSHPSMGGMIISGELEGESIGETIIVRTNPNSSEAASASVLI